MLLCEVSQCCEKHLQLFLQQQDAWMKLDDDESEDGYLGPQPLEVDATKDVIDDYFREVKVFSQEMRSCWKELNLSGESLWFDFVLSFRP